MRLHVIAGRDDQPAALLHEAQQALCVARVGRLGVGQHYDVDLRQVVLGQRALVHDGSFADEETDRAAETGHSTARQAAALAREAGVRLLALVHVSSRYDVRDVLAEAREELSGCEAPRDFDVVEVPFPERDAPRLIENGARAAARAPSS